MSLSTMASIKAFFLNAGTETLVTTRQLIKFGQRATVDTCTFNLVHEGVIVRVARGVFHLSGRQSPPSLEEVAFTKAKSFGRNIMRHALKVAEELDIRPKEQLEHNPNCFQIDGRSSSFKCGNTTIIFKGTSKKNFVLGDSPHGKVLRALQSMGKYFITEDMCDRALKTLQPSEHKSTLESCSFVSAWLSDIVIRWLFTAPLAKNAPAIASVIMLEDKSASDKSTNTVSEFRPEEEVYYPLRGSVGFLHQSDNVVYLPSTCRFRKNE